MDDPAIFKALSSTNFIASKFVNMIANDKDADQSLRRRMYSFNDVQNGSANKIAEILTLNHFQIISASKETANIEKEIQKMQNLLSEHYKILMESTNIKIPIFNSENNNNFYLEYIKDIDSKKSHIQNSKFLFTQGSMSFKFPIGLLNSFPNEDNSPDQNRIEFIFKINEILKKLKYFIIERNFDECTDLVLQVKEIVSNGNISAPDECFFNHYLIDVTKYLTNEIINIISNTSDVLLIGRYSVSSLINNLSKLGQSNLALKTNLLVLGLNYRNLLKKVKNEEKTVELKSLEQSITIFFEALRKGYELQNSYKNINFHSIYYFWIQEEIPYFIKFVIDSVFSSYISFDSFFKLCDSCSEIIKRKFSDIDSDISLLFKQSLFPYYEECLITFIRQHSLELRRQIKIDQWMFREFSTLPNDLQRQITDNSLVEEYEKYQLSRSVVYFFAIVTNVAKMCYKKRNFLQELTLKCIIEFYNTAEKSFKLASENIKEENMPFFKSNVDYFYKKLIIMLEKYFNEHSRNVYNITIVNNLKKQEKII